MKKIERLGLREANITSESQDAVIAMKLNELIDAHNELLDTHTVKEPIEHTTGSHFECKACLQAHILSHIVKEEHEEEHVEVEVVLDEPLTIRISRDALCRAAYGYVPKKEEPNNTVKEEKDSCPYGTQTCRYNGNLCSLCRKEEPTTPEKKYCKNCGIDYQDPIYCSLFVRSADKHEWI